MPHITANEAGRNACFIRRFEGAVRIIIDAIQNKEASKKEIIAALLILIRYANKTLKIRPTV